jgi:hypothetical protein
MKVVESVGLSPGSRFDGEDPLTLPLQGRAIAYDEIDDDEGAFLLPSPGGGGSIATTKRSFVIAIGVG